MSEEKGVLHSDLRCTCQNVADTCSVYFCAVTTDTLKDTPKTLIILKEGRVYISRYLDNSN